MLIITCDYCKTDFTLHNGNSTRRLYMQEPYLNHVETFCPMCQKGYYLFTNQKYDTALDECGVSFTIQHYPPPELHRRYNEAFYPHPYVDEEKVAAFVDELQSI